MASEPDDAPLIAVSSSMTLVGIDEETAVVFGLPPSDWEVAPLSLLSDTDLSRLTGAVTASLGLANVGAQLLNGMNLAHGLVRLSPDTLAALSHATPMTKDGWNLGTIVANGKIVEQIKWLPAGSAATVSVLATLGPSLTMLAMQLQLSRIERAVAEGVAVTTQVLRALEQAQWAELDGLNKSVLNALDEARHVGEVSPHVFAAVAGREPDLNAKRVLFSRRVEEHIRELGKLRDARSRSAWLRRNVETLMSDTQAMVLAEQAWYTYQFLRAGSVAADQSRATDRDLLKRIVDRAQAEHEAALASVGELLDELSRVFSMMADVPGRDRFAFVGGRRTAAEVSAAARATAQWVAHLRGTAGIAERPVPAPPLICTLPDGADELTNVLKRVRWSLEPDEEIVGLATVGSARPRCDYAMVTNTRLLLAQESDLFERAEISFSVPVEEIRYVRSTVNARRSASTTLQVATKHRDMEFTVRADKEFGPKVDQFTQLMASLMVLPSEEVPESPTSARPVLEIE